MVRSIINTDEGELNLPSLFISGSSDVILLVTGIKGDSLIGTIVYDRHTPSDVGMYGEDFPANHYNLYGGKVILSNEPETL